VHKWFTNIGFAAILAATGGALAGAAELTSTHPSHYAKPGASGAGGASSILPRAKQVRAGSNVVVRDEDTLLENWRLNADLSQACNRRLFRQKRDQYLVGLVEGRTYGAALGGHSSLVDRAQLSEKQVVYLFKGQGTTNCRVYHRLK